MTLFSLVTLPILILSLVMRYQKQIYYWLNTVHKGTGVTNHVCPPDKSDVKSMAPYPAQPIKGRERYRVMMDIRKLDAHNWLTLDKNYLTEHYVRDCLLREKRDEVLRCLPESAEACQEALEEVSEFLCQRYPTTFRKVTIQGQLFIENQLVGEKYQMSSKNVDGNNTANLEAAVRLTMEDLSILMQNEEGEYYL